MIFMKKQILILISVIVIAVGFFLYTKESSSNSGTLFETKTEEVEVGKDDYEDETEVRVETKEIEPDLQGTIFVDVQGEVVNPGVFEVDRDVRVGYLIDLAGGLTDSANVLGLNRAARIYDEMVIFVPHVDDVRTIIEPDSGDDVENNEESELISLSTACALKLQSLPGIGSALSANIIAHREANGAFSTIEELVNVPGIGNGILENIRELIKP